MAKRKQEGEEITPKKRTRKKRQPEEAPQEASTKIIFQSEEQDNTKLPLSRAYYGCWGFDEGFGRYLFFAGGLSDPGIITRMRQEGDSRSISITNTPMGLRDVWGASLSQIFAVGDLGVALFSRDGGDTWEQLKTPQGYGCFYHVVSDGNDRIWICTDSGSMLSSKDGGTTWATQKILEKRLLSLYRTDNGSLFVGTEGGALFTSKDQGETWIPLKSQTTESINRIWSDSRTLYAGCNGGVFLWSENHQEWFSETVPGEHNIEGGSTTLDGSVYLVGANGLILHRRPGEPWEKLTNSHHRVWWMSYSFADGATYFCGDGGRVGAHTKGNPVQIL